MKAKVLLLVVAGLVLCLQTGLAQNPPRAESEQASAAVNSAPPADPNAIIPLILIDDLPLTDAIRNLARQASLNYLMDPKVALGLPGADGKLAPLPNVSIRWEKVTAQMALEALLNNYGLQLIEDPKTKIARITTKDPAALEPMVTKVFRLNYANPTNVVAMVQSALTDTKQKGKVMADTRASSLVVVATEKELASIEELIPQLDTPTKQVLIEARLMEISRSPSTVKGVDWSGTLEAQSFSFGNGNTTASTTTTTPGTPTTVTLPGGRTITTSARSSSQTTMSTESGSGGWSLNTFNGLTPNIAFLNADGVKGVLSFLNKDADTQVISTPRTVTLDNEPATISVVRAVPIFQQSTVGVGGGGTASATKPEYTNMGTIFTVTPRISANDQIRLKVVPEVSSIFRTVTKKLNDQDQQADEYDIRKIETQVIIPSGHTLVLGGLMSDATKNIYSKVPILGDMPLFGAAFRHENKARDKKNLLIFVTPTIIKDTDFRPEETSFLKSKAVTISGASDFNNAWDSAKPKDWSNPEGTPQEEAVYDENPDLLKADGKARPQLPPN